MDIEIKEEIAIKEEPLALVSEETAFFINMTQKINMRTIQQNQYLPKMMIL